ncbi:PAS domain-containing protein [Falsiroseomonas sp.]|uniref:PAS domain-containing protein n=1 Tax=Falsiroseomonas sp. TaxID=2870721 RepID=UPI00272CD427|nr:PAS domain-containing protein [Falsiroseomonas sp.]
MLAAMVRDSAAPAALLWGPDLICLHNAAFLPLLPQGAPAQGRRCAALWPDGGGVAALVRAALAGQPMAPQTLAFPGQGGPAFFSLAVLPARDGAGALAGVLLTAVETTCAVQTERRSAFLLDLEAALRDLDSPEAVVRTAATHLGRHLGAGRCAFAEVDAATATCRILADWTDGSLPSAVGVHPLQDCGADQLAALRAGASLGLGEDGGGLTVPVLKRGELVAMLHLNNAAPRHWSMAEEALVREATGRIWPALQRRHAEARLRLSEQRLRRVQQIGRVGGFEIDLRTGQNHRSAEYMDLQGLEPRSAKELHQDWVARLHPEDRVRAERRYLDAVSDESGATDYAQEYRILTPGGGVRWIAARAEIERGPAGQALRMLGAHVDVTELKLAEAALAESVQRAREVLESLGDMLYALDSQAHIRFASRRALEMWGMRAEEVLGQPFPGLFPAVHGSLSWQVISAALTDRVEAHFCARSPLAGRWFEVNVHPAEGGGVTVAARDLEGRRQAEIQRRSAETALRQSEERLRLAQDAGGVGTWEWDVVSGAVHWSASCHRLFGTNPAAGADLDLWRAAIHPADRPRVDAELRQVLTSGAIPWSIEFRFHRAGESAVRWMSARGELVRDPATGRALRLRGVALDVTEQRATEERQTLLMRELDHRAKNALAVVQAAVRMTPKDDPEAFATAVLGRVAALARAHTLLAEGRWDGVALHDLVAGEMAPFLTPEGEGRVTASGPSVMIAPTAAQALAMALHELATNATKHGALSVSEGRIDLSWRLDARGAPGRGDVPRQLVLRWLERGGPPVAAPPQRLGFGSRVLEATIAGQLGGRIVLHWRGGGLDCEMRVPLSRALLPDLEQRLRTRD